MFKKLKTFLLSIFILNSSFVGLSKSTQAFGSLSHETITRIAFEKAMKDLGKQDFEEQTKFMVANCTGPDKDEKSGAGGAYQGHFLDVGDIEVDFMDRKQDNALKRLDKHFQSAVIAAKNNNIKMALYCLARALHYLQDMCCIVHLWGYSYNNIPAHLAFHRKTEDIADAMCKHGDKTGFILALVDSCYDLKINLSLTPVELGRAYSEETYVTFIGHYKLGKFMTVLAALCTPNPFFWIGYSAGPIVDLARGFYSGRCDHGLERMLTSAVQASYKLIHIFMNNVQEHFKTSKSITYK